jgi:hypothetical protein
VLVGVVTTLVAGRPDLDIAVLRQPGTLAATLAGGDVANFYTVQVFNRSHLARPLEIAAVEPAGATVRPLGPLDRVAAHGLVEGRLLLILPKAVASQPVQPVTLELRSGSAVVSRVQSSFIGSAQPAAQGTP